MLFCHNYFPIRYDYTRNYTILRKHKTSQHIKANKTFCLFCSKLPNSFHSNNFMGKLFAKHQQKNINLEEEVAKIYKEIHQPSAYSFIV